MHRIGRTGRAGQNGLAISLLTEKEHYKLERLSHLLDQALTAERLPTTRYPAGSGHHSIKPKMITLQIDAGKKQKIRPGDIVGALTGEGGIAGDQVGKIQVFDFCAYVAVNRDVAREALEKLSKGKLKGRACRARIIKV